MKIETGKSSNGELHKCVKLPNGGGAIAFGNTKSELNKNFETVATALTITDALLDINNFKLKVYTKEELDKKRSKAWKPII